MSALTMAEGYGIVHCRFIGSIDHVDRWSIQQTMI